MVKMNPTSIRPRQLVAPLFVLSLAVLGLASFWLDPARWLLAAELGCYTVLSVASAALIARHKRQSSLLPLLPVSFLLIHLTWGAGFLMGLTRASQPKANSATRRLV